MGGTSSSKRERNKRDKHQRILDAAERLFREQGFEATTTAQIAAAAGIGAGTLYLYVGSKEDLLVSVFRTSAGAVWEEAFRRYDPDDRLIDQIMAIFGHVSTAHDRERELARAFFRQLQFVAEPARSIVSEFLSATYRRMSVVIERSADRGGIDPAVPIRDLTSNLFALWFLRMQRHAAGTATLAETLGGFETDVRTALWGMTPST